MTAPLFAYKGNGPDGRSKQPQTEAWLGTKLAGGGDFLDYSNRGAFDNDVTFTANGWKGYDRPLILGVPNLCKGETFADIVAGKHDASYVRFANTFNAAGIKLLAIRLGWEDNVQTTPGYASQDVAGYKAARRHLYALLKPLLPGTLILQDFANGWQQVTQDKLFDKASADGLGWTLYPQTWNGAAVAEPAFSKNLMAESWGANTLRGWYADLPVIVTEWGAAGTRSDGHGAPNGGDDPVWTQTCLDLFASLGDRLKGVVLWDFHAGDFNGLMSGGAFPNAGAVLKAAYAPAPVTAPVAAPAPLSAKVSPIGTGTVTMQANADGSAWVNLAIATGGHHRVALSEARKVGSGPKALWFNGQPVTGFDWDSAGTGKVYVGAK